MKDITCLSRLTAPSTGTDTYSSCTSFDTGTKSHFGHKKKKKGRYYQIFSGVLISLAKKYAKKKLSNSKKEHFLEEHVFSSSSFQKLTERQSLSIWWNVVNEIAWQQVSTMTQWKTASWARPERRNSAAALTSSARWAGFQHETALGCVVCAYHHPTHSFLYALFFRRINIKQSF